MHQDEPGVRQLFLTRALHQRDLDGSVDHSAARLVEISARPRHDREIARYKVKNALFARPACASRSRGQRSTRKGCPGVFRFEFSRVGIPVDAPSQPIERRLSVFQFLDQHVDWLRAAHAPLCRVPVLACSNRLHLAHRNATFAVAHCDFDNAFERLKARQLQQLKRLVRLGGSTGNGVVASSKQIKDGEFEVFGSGLSGLKQRTLLVNVVFAADKVVGVRTIYAPLRERGTGAVIAVVEIADNAEPSKAQLDAIRKRTWLVVGISTVLMIAMLFGIVYSGSRTIDRQRAELQRRYEEQTRLAEINKDLSERLQESNRHGIELPARWRRSRLRRVEHSGS